MSEETKRILSIRDEITTDEGVKQAGEVVTPRKEAPTPVPNWLKALGSDSPDKEISAYTNHPLNFDGEDSTGRIIRGCEGIIGNLNKSIVDIAVGVIQKVSKMFEGRETKQRS